MWRIICIGTVGSAVYHGGDLVQVTLNRLSRAGGGGWLGCAQISMPASLICFVAILYLNAFCNNHHVADLIY